MISAVAHAFPGALVMGEEDSEILRKDTEKRDLLWGHMKAILDQSEGSKEVLGSIKDAETMMDWIDTGDYEGGSTSSMSPPLYCHIVSALRRTGGRKECHLSG